MAKTMKRLKRIFVAVAGATILAIGLVMILTPGPAILVIPIGLSVLATEFECMRKLESKLKTQVERIKNRVTNG